MKRPSNAATSRKLSTFLARVLVELRTRKLLSHKKPTVELSLMPNAHLRKLKKQYLKKDVEIVDVLSFPSKDFPDPEAGPGYLGEVYINEDIARDDFDRALFLLIHGVLHLLGFRHEKKHDIIMMESLEQELLHALK